MPATLKPASPGFGANLRRLRIKSGLSLAELGELCGLTHASLSMMERGITHGNLRTIIRISEALHCSVEKLVRNIDKS